MEIWKFELPIDNRVDIEMPVISRPLSVTLQGDTPFLWALVDPSSGRQKTRFHVVGTGHSASHVNPSNFIDTILMADGALVFHIFKA